MAERRLPALVVGMVVLAALAFVATGIMADASLPGRLLRGGGFLAGPRAPTCAPAVVDGDAGEWVLADDVFADVYRAGENEGKVEARLHLRYDCRTDTIYALLLSAGDWPVLSRSSQTRLALDSANDDAPPLDFAWLEPGYDGNSSHARGWEAAFAAGPGEHLLWVAAHVVDEGLIQEVGTTQGGTLVALDCRQATNIYLSRLEAVPTGGRVRLEWETAWEVNNLGFNVYYGRSPDGPWTRLNRGLLASQAGAGETAGARYEFEHAGVDLEAENYYLLEELAADGVATRHGPVSP
jgi:hypothetical protein